MSRAGPLHARLPLLQPETARRQTRLVAALVGAGLVVRRADPASAPAAWIGCVPHGAVRVFLAPRLVRGVAVSLLADDGAPCAVAALDALAPMEPLLIRVERALGIPLVPDELTGLPDGFLADLAPAEPAEAGPDRLWMAVAGPIEPAPPRARPERLPPACRLPVTVEIDAAPLAKGLVGAIGAGALLLLGVGPYTGSVALGRRRLAARFDIAARSAHLTDSLGDDMAADDPALPLAVRIEGTALPLSDATSLGPGSVIDLPGKGPTLAVTVLLGGAAVARGDLVAVGDGFGVLITERIGDE